jgi:hypothetical protein
MNNVMPMLIKIYDGPPNLTVTVVSAKNSIDAIMPGVPGPTDTSTVTVTVHNRLSFPSGPFQAEPNTIPAFGREAKNVQVSIGLSIGLRQVGNIIWPVGFSAAVTANNQIIIFIGGTIPAGARVDFVFEVFGEARGGMDETIWADVQPSFPWNQASTTIFVRTLN